jgi:hypothetical protein
MTSPPNRIGTLLGFSAVLAGVLALEIVYGPFFVPEARPVSSPGAKNHPVVSSNEPPPDKPPISTFAEIVERPLFAQSRRPAPKKETKVAEAAPKPETFDLIGVVISPAGRMALLRTIATSEIVRAVEGQNVGGWEVHAIKPMQVVLRRGDDSDVLKLSDAAALPAGSPAVVNNPSGMNNSASGEANSPSPSAKPSLDPGSGGAGIE